MIKLGVEASASIEYVLHIVYIGMCNSVAFLPIQITLSQNQNSKNL